MVKRPEETSLRGKFPISIDQIAEVLADDEELRKNHGKLRDACNLTRNEELNVNCLFLDKKYKLLFKSLLDHWTWKHRGEEPMGPLLTWLQKQGFGSTAESLAEMAKVPLPRAPGAKEKKSEIDRNRALLAERAVVSFVRTEDYNHILLVGETYEERIPRMIVFDFVSQGTAGVVLPNLKNGVVRVFGPYENKAGEKKKLIDLHNKSGKVTLKNLAALRAGMKAFIIDMSLDRFKEMEKKIQDQKERRDGPIFNIFGYASLSTMSTAAACSAERGHSCYTWANAQVVEADDSVEIPTAWGRFIISIPGDSLWGENKLRTYMVLGVAAVVLAYILYNYDVKLSPKL